MAERALLLVNMGGPSHASEIEGYLRAIFLDPAILPLPELVRPVVARLIARRRAPKVAERYRLIGGASPLPEWTRRQAAGVAAALPPGSAMAVEHAFRYTSPTIAEALGALAERGARQVRLLPLFPHHTDAMTGSVVREARRAAEPLGLALETVPAWGLRADVIALWERMLAAALGEAGPRARVLFVAHGIPLRNVRRGDDYPHRVRDTAERLGRALPEGTAWTCAFQSRVGPVAWTGPYLEDELDRLASSLEPLVVMPLSFAADCLETLYDLDEVASARAARAGVSRFVRVPAFNDDASFSAILAAMATGPLGAEARS